MKRQANKLDFFALYAGFHIPSCDVDCGEYCAPHNPSGKPFCCDQEVAVPAVYDQEWDFLQTASKQWHLYQAKSEEEQQSLTEETPSYMLLAACQGPQHCHRPTRAISCRQFPFFPYITADWRFIGLSVEWEFEEQCWLINHLEAVTDAYRQAFIDTYDQIFDVWMDDFESYALHAQEMRAVFRSQRRRIPILHRNGNNYLLSPATERMEKMRNFPKIRSKFYRA